MAANRGITLIELIIVITIIGVLIVTLGFSFKGWMGNYRVESQTKEMYVDLMNARARAMQRNRTHFATGNAATYAIYEDTNPSPDGDGFLQTASDTLLKGFPKTVRYNINWTGSGNIITFDTRGLVSPDGSIWFTLPSGLSPDYDCIVVFSTRINIGKWNGTTNKCDAK